MSISITETTYKNFGKCVQIENESIKMLVTIDVGPRIIYFSLNGSENILLEDEERRFETVLPDGGKWYAYGGHRLWVSPELIPETYLPDNEPVSYMASGNSITFAPPITAAKKRMSVTITFDSVTSEVRLSHKITNLAEDTVEFAAWAITALASGGVEVMPQCRRDGGYLSNRSLVLWSYTDINDPRLTLKNDYAVLRQDPQAKTNFKMGFNNEDGWAAYHIKGQLFTKRLEKLDRTVVYPDGGCNFETYTNSIFLECETLSPLMQVKHGESITLTEKWSLSRLDNLAEFSDSFTVDDFAEKYINT